MTRPRLTLRPYKVGDADHFEPRSDFAAEHRVLGWPLDEPTPPPGLAWTLLRAGAPVGCGGVAPPAHFHPGASWTAWAYLSDLMPREIVQAVRLASKALAFCDAERGVDIDATCRTAFAGAARVLERLGFAPSGDARPHPDLPPYTLMTRSEA